MSEAEVALRSMSAFVDQLAHRGLEHACLSPGSRSTPIALALSRHPQVRLHVHLDERAGAFFALGIAKSTGRPVVVACTSGTAAAGFLPAVVEASTARAPLVVLTADRPPELRGVGANQTIEQVGIFGGYVRASWDAPVPGDDADEQGWRERAGAAVHAAMSRPPGPVHVNLPFREPLVPETSGSPLSGDPSVQTGGQPLSGDPSVRTGGVVDPSPVPEGLVEELRVAGHGAIVAGSLRVDAPSVIELAGRLGWPLLAEPTSQLRGAGALAAGQFLLSNQAFVEAHRPDLVLQIGAAPTSRAGLAFVGATERLVIVDPDDLVADPHRRAVARFVVDAEASARQAIDALPAAEGTWGASWAAADGRARRAVDGLLDAWEEPFEGRIARDLAASLPEGSTLVVGSSMPVRDLDTYMAPRGGLRVIANRGASGIDGFVSTALGVAASGTETTALCGDLTLLHDVGSLLWSARRGLDCVFVVPNNDGGAIFSFLPQRALPELEELFTTPHRLDLAAICSAAGAGHARVERAADLAPAVTEARSAGGVHVVEVPTDRETNVARHAEVHAAVDPVLREMTG